MGVKPQGQGLGPRPAAWLPAVVAVALAAGAAAVVAGAGELARARGELASAQEAMAAAQVRAEQVRRQERLEAGLARLMAAADARGLRPESWGERQVQLRQASVSREDANRLLDDLLGRQGRYVDLREFDLAVTQQAESLFAQPAGHDHPLRLSLRGVAYFRLGE